MKDMKLHEGVGLSAAFGGTRDRRDVTHEHSREIKTTSEVITGNCATVITSEVVLPCAAFVCDVPPIVRPRRSRALNPALSECSPDIW